MLGVVIFIISSNSNILFIDCPCLKPGYTVTCKENNTFEGEASLIRGAVEK